jgi:hypothetical protein
MPRNIQPIMRKQQVKFSGKATLPETEGVKKVMFEVPKHV